MKIRTDKRGITLVEALVGVAVFSICALILVTGFTAAYSMIRKGQDLKIQGEKASAAIEGAGSSDIQIEHTDGNFTFTIDGRSIELNGQYTATEDGSGNNIFTEFTTDVK